MTAKPPYFNIAGRAAHPPCANCGPALMAKMRLVLPCSIWLLSIILPATVIAEKPFNFESTPGKLPKQVVPTEYSIRIIPDIEKLTFT